MTVNPTDKFLVNRNGSSYYVEQQNLMAQLDPSKGDILLVNRGGASYKIGAQDFIDSITPPAEIATPTILTPEDGAGMPDQPLSSDTISTTEAATIPGGWNDTGFPKTNGVGAFTYGNGIYIGTHGDTSSEIYYSQDCENWSKSNMPQLNKRVCGPAFSDGKFIVIVDTAVYTSTDGAIWSVTGAFPETATQGPYLNTAGGYVYAGGNKLYRSNDHGNTWTECTGISGYNAIKPNGMAYHNGTFILNAGSDSSGIIGAFWSTDGLAWTKSTGFPIVSSSAAGMEYFKGYFYIVVDSTAVYRSSDGKAFTAIPGSPTKGSSIAQANGALLATSFNSAQGGNSRSARSLDGTTWTYFDDPYSPTANMATTYRAGDRFIWSGSSVNSAVGAAWSYTGSDDDLVGTKLNLSGSKGLSSFSAGMAVIQDNLDPTTDVNIYSIDESSNSMVVWGDGNWNEGDVNYVVGPDYISVSNPPAPDAADLVFTSSVPEAETGTINTWGNAEWEVKKSNESTWINNIQPIVPGTVQQLAPGTFTLDPNTQYDVRVTYTANGVEPKTSEVNTFKTAEEETTIDVSAEPGQLWSITQSNSCTAPVYITTPALVKGCANMNPQQYSIYTVDEKVYFIDTQANTTALKANVPEDYSYVAPGLTGLYFAKPGVIKQWGYAEYTHGFTDNTTVARDVLFSYSKGIAGTTEDGDIFVKQTASGTVLVFVETTRKYDTIAVCGAGTRVNTIFGIEKGTNTVYEIDVTGINYQATAPFTALSETQVATNIKKIVCPIFDLATTIACLGIDSNNNLKVIKPSASFPSALEGLAPADVVDIGGSYQQIYIQTADKSVYIAGDGFHCGNGNVGDYKPGIGEWVKMDPPKPHSGGSPGSVSAVSGVEYVHILEP